MIETKTRFTTIVEAARNVLALKFLLDGRRRTILAGRRLSRNAAFGPPTSGWREGNACRTAACGVMRNGFG